MIAHIYPSVPDADGGGLGFGLLVVDDAQGGRRRRAARRAARRRYDRARFV